MGLVAEHVLVAVGPAPQSADLIRAAHAMAGQLGLPWLAASVETPSLRALGADARARLDAHLAMAEKLGAEVVVVREESVGDALVGLARRRNVRRILIGRPTHPQWRDRLTGSLMDALIRQADGIDVIVTDGRSEPAPVRPTARPAPPSAWGDYAEGVAWIAGAAIVGLLARPWLTDADEAMVLLVAVIVAAARVGPRASLATALLSVVLFDMLFVPPWLSLAVDDARHLLTFGVMLGAAVLVSRLTSRVREQAETARVREARTAALYAMSRQLAQAADPDEIARVAAAHIRDTLGIEARVRVGEAGGEAPGCLLLVGSRGPVGQLAIDPASALSPDQQLLLETFATKTALALERSLLAEAAERSRMAAETERLRNELLSAVSHDLRTPLASITGAASALLADDRFDAVQRHELLSTIFEEGERLGRIVSDLLDLTRIESGTVQVAREPFPIEELIATVLERLDGPLRGRSVRVEVPSEVLLGLMDVTLMEQVLVNLVENAAKYTPAGSPIEVRAEAEPDGVVIEVADRGPGIPAGEEEVIFDKFFRATDHHRAGSSGLGLTICRAVVHAHGGTIEASNREGGGALFRVRLPGRAEESPEIA